MAVFMKEQPTIYSVPLETPPVQVVEYQLDEVHLGKISDFVFAIHTARQRTPHSETGDWGVWTYARGSGEGSLYVPSENGLTAVWLRCGGDIGEDDISQAHFQSLLSYWGQRQNSSISAAFAISSRTTEPGSQSEADWRKYFFYEEKQKGKLVLSVLGSQKLGWFKIEEVPKKVRELSFDFYAVPVVFPKNNFLDMLEYCRSSQTVTPHHIEDIHSVVNWIT